jgi:hypothetical protein
MGKEIRPKREELEFLFNLFLQGYEKDDEVLGKYLELNDDGKLRFPLRTDRRIIKQIREEFAAARTVLEPYLKKQIDPAASKLYQEHQHGLIHLVKRLSTDLEPHLSSLRLRSLEGQGSHSSLIWQVENDGSVSLHYRLELVEDTETKIMRRYLEQHLRSSSYSWLTEDNEKGINKWKQVGGEELKRRTRLLNQIDRDVEKLTGKPLSDLNRMNYTGPSTWFSESIQSAVLDGLYRTLDYKVEPIDGGLFKAQYGASFIGLTPTMQDGEQYVDWHKRLMVKFGQSKTVMAINQLKRERESITTGIRDVLTKFVVDKHIPGKCNYEFCR